MEKQALASRKKNLVYLRAVISLVIMLIAAYHHEKVLAGGYVPLYLLFVIAANFIFIFIPDKFYEGVKLQYIVFVLDLLIMVLGAYYLTDMDFSVLVAIFLTVFASALSRSLSASIGIAVVMNALYLYFKFSVSETGFEGLVREMSFLNMPLIFLAAVHSSYLAEKAEEDAKAAERLQKANAVLLDKAKRAGEDMEELINFTSRVYDSFREAVIITDSSGAIKAFNTAAESMFCQRRSKAVNMNYADLESIKPLHDIFDALKFRKKTAEQLDIKAADGGTIKNYTVNSSYIQDRDDTVLGMLVTVRMRIEKMERA